MPLAKISMSDSAQERLVNVLEEYMEETEPFQSAYRREHDTYMRSYLTIPDSATRDFPWPNAANFFAPLSRVILDGLLSQTYDAMFSRDPTIEVQGTEGMDVEEAEDLSLFYGEYVWTKLLNLKIFANDWLFDTYLAGTGVVNCQWVRNQILNRVQETEIVDDIQRMKIEGFGEDKFEDLIVGKKELVVERTEVREVDMPRVDHVDMTRFFVPPNSGTSLQWPNTRYYYVESFLTKEEVMERKRQGYKVSDAVMAQFAQNPDTVQDRAKKEKLGLGTSKTKTVRFLEFFMRFPLATEITIISPDGTEERKKQSGDEDDAFSEEVIVNYWPDTKEIARVVPLGRVKLDGKRPHVENRYKRFPRFFYGMGVMASMDHMQRLANASINQQIDYGSLQNLPFYFYEPNATGMMPEIFPLQPGLGVPVMNANGVRFPSFQGNADFFQGPQQIAQRWAERDSSVSDFNLGTSPALPNAPRTFGGTAALLQQSNISFGRLVALLAQPFLEVFRQVHAYYQKHATPEITFPVLNKRTGAFTKKTVMRSAFQNPDVDFSFVLNPDRLAEQQTNMQLFQLMSALPSVQGDPRIVRQLAKNVWNSMGKKGFDQLWPENQLAVPQVGIEGEGTPGAVAPPTGASTGLNGDSEDGLELQTEIVRDSTPEQEKVQI